MNTLTLNDLNPAAREWLSSRNMEAYMTTSGNVVTHCTNTVGHRFQSALFSNVEHLNSWAESTQHMNQK